MSSFQDPYVEFLRSRTDRVFYRLPYPGNAGDSLIQFATQQILDDLQIRTTVDPRRADVILVPGGNPSMWPDIGAERWRMLWKRYPQAEFIVGPAGFRTDYREWSEAIRNEGSRVTGVFARDPDSYDSLRKADFRADICLALSHDPVLYLRQSTWLAAHREAATTEYDLTAFRDDHETDLGLPELWQTLRKLLPGRIYNPLVRRRAAAVRSQNVTLARKLGGGTVPLLQNDVSRQRFEVFVETIRAARTVHTDRLHVLLLAVMLGKKAYVYSTSHGKLEGIYRHSLADWADVTLVGEMAKQSQR